MSVLSFIMDRYCLCVSVHVHVWLHPCACMPACTKKCRRAHSQISIHTLTGMYVSIKDAKSGSQKDTHTHPHKRILSYSLSLLLVQLSQLWLLRWVARPARAGLSPHSGRTLQHFAKKCRRLSCLDITMQSLQLTGERVELADYPSCEVCHLSTHQQPTNSTSRSFSCVCLSGIRFSVCLSIRLLFPRKLRKYSF